MKTIEELKQYYQTKLIPEIQHLEVARKKTARNVILGETIVVSLVILFGFFIIPRTSGQHLGDSIEFTLFLAVAACWGTYWFFTRNYRSDFKDKVIEEIVRFAHPSLKYKKASRISKPTYEMSRIFPQRIDVYNGDDLVAGKVEKTDIQFSELHTEYITRSNKRNHRHTIFKGLFFVGDFNKNFNGHTLVLPDIAENLFGQFGSLFQSWNKSRGELIKLEDPEFEKAFAVYGNDQIEARYILSTSLIRRIVEFKRKHRRKIYLSFVASKVFVAISYARNLFEPKIFTTLLNFAPIEEYFSDLSLAIGIVEELNLNTRIWTKT